MALPYVAVQQNCRCTGLREIAPLFVTSISFHTREMGRGEGGMDGGKAREKEMETGRRTGGQA